MHTTPNGKRYIGITKQSVANRWGKRGERYKRCPAFWRAIQKYGWENISHEIIDYAPNLEVANAKEQHYILFYKTNNNEYGYNCTEGGDGVQGWRATTEQREKNSQAKRKMWENEDIRERLTEERQKRGRTSDEKERLKRMLEASWDNPVTSAKMKAHLKSIATNPEYIESRRQKIKHYYADDPEFKAKMTKHLEKIHSDPEIHKKQGQSMKIRWSENREVFLQNRVYLTGKDNPASRPIICLETNKEYPTARAAELDTGISFKSISNVVRGKSKTAGGFHWKYVDEDLNATVVGVEKPKTKQVKCLETGVIYDSISLAAKATGISRNSIGNCVRGLTNTAGKLHWEYV